jgi:hypothetical protein
MRAVIGVGPHSGNPGGIVPLYPPTWLAGTDLSPPIGRSIG